MAGVKRKDLGDNAAATNGKKVKKPKTDLAVKPMNAKKVPKADRKANKPKAKAVTVPADDLDQSDTTEEENGFYGFSAAEEDGEEGGVSLLSSADDDGDEEAQETKFAGKGDRITKSGTTSREAHAKQKQLTKERKAARPMADEIQRAKKIWERLRIKTNVPKEERKKLLKELFSIIEGRVKDFVFKHDSVRTIQCALKYGDMQQKQIIAEELKGSYRDLISGRFSKFLVAKLITEGNEQIRSMIIEEFYGHVRKLINHPEGSWLLDDAYRQVASAPQKTKLLREWYGPEFTIFRTAENATITSDLSIILKETPDKRKPIMDYLHQMINQCIQKKLTGFTMLHDAMLQYYLNVPADGSEAADSRTLMIGDKEEEEVDLLKNLAFTKSGSQLVCLALAHGSAKERKQILRAYKDSIEMLAFDKHGYLVLLTAYEVIDDTREIASRILSELVSLNKTATEDMQHDKVLALCEHLSGHTVLFYPFVGPAKWLIPVEAQKHLDKVFEIRKSTSKKNAQVRQGENIASLSPPVLSTVAAHAATLAQSNFGSTLIREVLLNGVGDKDAALAAVADLAAGDPNEESHIANSPAGSRMLKALVPGGPYDPVAKKVTPIEPALNFHDLLYDRIKDQVLDWATGMGSLVIVALMEADGFTKKDELKKTLKKEKKRLSQAATEETSVQRAMRERRVEEEAAAAAEAEGTKKGRKPKPKKEAVVGNRGAQILLEMLG